MAIWSRSRTATAAGTIMTLLLVLIFGNQAFTEWVARHTHQGTVWGWFMRELSWPAWAFGPTDNSAAAQRSLLAHDLRAFLLVVFVAAILAATANSVAGGASFLVGWSSVVFASALAALATAFIIANASWLTAFAAASAGSAYGLFVGWIVGIAVAGAKGGAAPAAE